MTIFCQYSMIRYRPCSAAGEFVNVGVALFANSGDFGYRIDPRMSRVALFFPHLDDQLYVRAIDSMERELNRIELLFSKGELNQELKLKTFKNLIEPSESLIQFSQAGVIETVSISGCLDDLLHRYVTKVFDSPA